MNDSSDRRQITLTMSGGATIVLHDKTVDEVQRMIRAAWNSPQAPGSMDVTGSGPSDGLSYMINLRLIAGVHTDVTPMSALTCPLSDHDPNTIQCTRHHASAPRGARYRTSEHNSGRRSQPSADERV